MSTADALAAPDVEALMGEIARYLAAVDVFRKEGREPRWTNAQPPAVPGPRPDNREDLR